MLGGIKVISYQFETIYNKQIVLYIKIENFELITIHQTEIKQTVLSNLLPQSRGEQS